MLAHVATDCDPDPLPPAPAMTETPLDVDDLSGGELIGVNEDAEGVEVELPQTEMTNASQEEIDAAAAQAEEGE